jgi:hypothetical protein
MCAVGAGALAPKQRRTTFIARATMASSLHVSLRTAQSPDAKNISAGRPAMACQSRAMGSSPRSLER